MNENKQNTALLIVIAVATLLVAVVGATFAYFTAANQNNSTAVYTSSSAKMIISYLDGTAELKGTLDAGNTVQPGNTILIDKTFTLTGTNTAKATGTGITDTTGIDMPYTVYLTYENGFTSDDNEGGLYYYIKGTTTGDVTAVLEGTKVTNEGDTLKDYTKKLIPTGRLGGAEKAENGLYPTEVKELKLASGVFKPNLTETLATVQFNLKITFPDNGKPQNSNKGQKFTGKIEINKNLAEVTTKGK